MRPPARSWWLCGGSADASRLSIKAGASTLLDVAIPGAAASLGPGTAPPVGALWLDQATQCYGGTTLLPSTPGAPCAAVHGNHVVPACWGLG